MLLAALVPPGCLVVLDISPLALSRTGLTQLWVVARHSPGRGAPEAIGLPLDVEASALLITGVVPERLQHEPVSGAFGLADTRPGLEVARGALLCHLSCAAHREARGEVDVVADLVHEASIEPG